MGFWNYMFIISLLVPINMIIFGKYFSKKAPANIKGLFGYRTSMSTKNEQTWEFAHKYCGRIWFYSGIILLIVSLIAMLLLRGKDKIIVNDYSLTLTGVQIIFLLSPILPTEIALRKKFDTDGNRKL